MAIAQHGVDQEREGPGDTDPVHIQRHHSPQTTNRGRQRQRLADYTLN